jgi:hypothetical protein
MRSLRRSASLLLVSALGAFAVPVTTHGAADAASTTPTLVGIRAAHHPTFDRVVFRFRGGLPTSARTRYVERLVSDGAGARVRIAGRAILRVRFGDAQAHDEAGPTVPRRTAFALPNVMTTVRAGDFEAVTTYGIGLARRTRVNVFTLRRPSRVVVDIRAAFPTVNRQVYFVDADNVASGSGPFFVPVSRPVRPLSPAVGVMDRLFAGPLPSERADGLRLVRSGANGFAGLTIADGIARIGLTGGCGSGGSTVTIAGEIFPTLRQFSTVDWVKIFDPEGNTQDPSGDTDSIPTCLEP